MIVSIITVCKNSENTIERCISSVVEQTYDDIEYIVVDGKSTDKTIDILKQYRNHISTFVSEKDHGIYDAMNKGIALSKGKVLFFLNSDDYFIDEEVITDVMTDFKKSEKVYVIYGDVVVLDGEIFKKVEYSSISKKYFYNKTICHQALFIRKEMFELIGNYDERYVIHADTDWLLKAYFNPKNIGWFKHIDRTICCFSNDGFCSDPLNAARYKFHRQEISAKYFLEARIKLFFKRIMFRIRN